MSPAWIDRVVKRIDPEASWSDLSLAEEQMQALQRIVEIRSGEAGRFKTVSALLTGSDAAVQQRAVEAVASDLGETVYRIDLALLKGDRLEETERALKRVLDAADRSRGILLFAEGDSLFGAGSADERYPELGGSYLVKQMGRYEGVSFLSVTAADSVDLALRRRLKPTVQCP